MAATAPLPRTRASSRPLASALFPFVQFEVAGTVGLEEGRYLGRDPERVLVVRVAHPSRWPSPMKFLFLAHIKYYIL